MGTNRDSKLLSQSRCDKPQDNTAKSDAKPEPGGSHTTREPASLSHSDHEGDNPASKTDLDTHVADQEHGSKPGDTRRWHLEYCFFKA